MDILSLDNAELYREFYDTSTDIVSIARLQTGMERQVLPELASVLPQIYRASHTFQLSFWAGQSKALKDHIVNERRTTGAERLALIAALLRDSVQKDRPLHGLKFSDYREYFPEALNDDQILAISREVEECKSLLEAWRDTQEQGDIEPFLSEGITSRQLRSLMQRKPKLLFMTLVNPAIINGSKVSNIIELAKLYSSETKAYERQIAEELLFDTTGATLLDCMPVWNPLNTEHLVDAYSALKHEHPLITASLLNRKPEWVRQNATLINVLAEDIALVLPYVDADWVGPGGLLPWELSDYANNAQLTRLKGIIREAAPLMPIPRHREDLIQLGIQNLQRHLPTMHCHAQALVTASKKAPYLIDAQLVSAAIIDLAGCLIKLNAGRLDDAAKSLPVTGSCTVGDVLNCIPPECLVNPQFWNGIAQFAQRRPEKHTRIVAELILAAIKLPEMAREGLESLLQGMDYGAPSIEANINQLISKIIERNTEKVVSTKDVERLIEQLAQPSHNKLPTDLWVGSRWGGLALEYAKDNQLLSNKEYRLQFPVVKRLVLDAVSQYPDLGRRWLSDQLNGNYRLPEISGETALSLGKSILEHGLLPNPCDLTTNQLNKLRDLFCPAVLRAAISEHTKRLANGNDNRDFHHYLHAAECYAPDSVAEFMEFANEELLEDYTKYRERSQVIDLNRIGSLTFSKIGQYLPKEVIHKLDNSTDEDGCLDLIEGVSTLVGQAATLARRFSLIVECEKAHDLFRTVLRSIVFDGTATLAAAIDESDFNSAANLLIRRSELITELYESIIEPTWSKIGLENGIPEALVRAVKEESDVRDQLPTFCKLPGQIEQHSLEKKAFEHLLEKHNRRPEFAEMASALQYFEQLRSGAITPQMSDRESESFSLTDRLVVAASNFIPSNTPADYKTVNEIESCKTDPFGLLYEQGRLSTAAIKNLSPTVWRALAACLKTTNSSDVRLQEQGIAMLYGAVITNNKALARAPADALASLGEWAYSRDQHCLAALIANEHYSKAPAKLTADSWLEPLGLKYSFKEGLQQGAVNALRNSSVPVDNESPALKQMVWLALADEHAYMAKGYPNSQKAYDLAKSLSRLVTTQDAILSGPLSKEVIASSLSTWEGLQLITSLPEDSVTKELFALIGDRARAFADGLSNRETLKRAARLFNWADSDKEVIPREILKQSQATDLSRYYTYNQDSAYRLRLNAADLAAMAYMESEKHQGQELPLYLIKLTSTDGRAIAGISSMAKVNKAYNTDPFFKAQVAQWTDFLCLSPEQSASLEQGLRYADPSTHREHHDELKRIFCDRIKLETDTIRQLEREQKVVYPKFGAR